jgi:hypothetical protein
VASTALLRRLAAITALAAAVLPIWGCSQDRDPVGQQRRSLPVPEEEAAPAPTVPDRPYINDPEALANRWYSERGRARFGTRSGPSILEVACEEDNEDLVVTRSLPLGRNEELAMTITAGEVQVEGYWRGVSTGVERGLTRIPASHPIVDAMTTAKAIRFTAEGFEDINAPNSPVLETVTRRCSAAG